MLKTDSKYLLLVKSDGDMKERAQKNPKNIVIQVFVVDEYPEPPKMVSSAPVRKVSSAELKELQALYDQMLRQFRIYLRELLGVF